MNERRHKEATAWGLYQAAVQRTKAPSAREERELFKRRDAGDESAVSELVERNQRLVLRVVNKYLRTTDDDYLDTVQEGNIGLLAAIRDFDPKKKVRLVAYAQSFITGRVVESLYSRHLIPAPSPRKRRKKDQGKPIPSLVWYDEMDSYIRDLLLNTWTTDSGSDPLENLLNNETRDRFDAAVDALPKIERQIVRLKYGLGTPNPMTAEEVGDVLGISTRRVKQILADALRHLRNEVSKQDYDYTPDEEHRFVRGTAPKPGSDGVTNE